jgi:hypothetical protein
MHNHDAHARSATNANLGKTPCSGELSHRAHANGVPFLV